MMFPILAAAALAGGIWLANQPASSSELRVNSGPMSAIPSISAFADGLPDYEQMVQAARELGAQLREAYQSAVGPSESLSAADAAILRALRSGAQAPVGPAQIIHFPIPERQQAANTWQPGMFAGQGALRINL